MAKYIAFLRGINVGGKNLKMEELRKVFESLGYENVRTLLASGNVIFDARATGEGSLRNEIEAGIKLETGLDVHIILRSGKDIQALVKSDPFKGVKLTPKTQLYVTFLSKPSVSKLKMPYKSKDGDYVVRQIAPSHIIGVVTLGIKGGTLDYMDFLSKEFGKEITTRNWITVKKVHAVLES